jgi:exodeoxyribonuclease VII large subunit
MSNSKPQVFSVSEFNEYVDLLVSQKEVIVEGEISELNIAQERWVFITLKDEEASCEVFAYIEQISTLPLLEAGMLVQVFGRPRIHKKTGRFRIWAEEILPTGEGALRVAFEKLRQRLEKEGLFDPKRKRPIPRFPERIGLITAKGSRAYSDFIKILGERFGGLKIYFYPVSVQGFAAISLISRALAYFNTHPELAEVLVLTRGGGGLEDLAAFNSEEIARAVFASKIPVVSAIGHEEDEALTDYVADSRASSPSNAAALIVRHRGEVKSQVEFLVSAIKNTLKARLYREENRVGSLTQTLSHVILQSLQEKEIKLKNLERLLASLDYKRILARGFSITFDEKEQVLKYAKDIVPASRIKTQLFEGKIYSRVLEKKGVDG